MRKRWCSACAARNRRPGLTPAPRRAHVTRAAVRAGAVDHRLGAAEQGLHGRARQRTVLEHVQQDRALAAAEGDECEAYAVAVADRGIELVRRRLVGDAARVERLHLVARGRRETDLVRRLADPVAHLAKPDRQHLVAQRLVGRGQPVQPERAHQEPQGGAVDQQGEEYETGGDNRHEMLNFRRQARVLDHRQRHRQRDRPAQAAPDQHHLEA